MRNGAVLGAAIALTSLSACVASVTPDEELRSHDDQEVTVSLEDLMATWTQEGEWMVSPPLDTPEGASRVGVLITLSAPGALPAMEARVLEGGAPAGEWSPLVATWGEEEMHVATVDFGAIGESAQLRMHADEVAQLQILRWTAAIPDPEQPEQPEEEDGEEESDIAGASEALRSELRGHVVSRSAWGARRTRCSSTNTTKQRFAIHHTVTGSSNPARQMRGIQRFHMDSRGWCDVGYHFLIGSDGRIYEGRPLRFLGAHVGGHNTGNIGISFIGCYHTSGCGGLGPTTPSSNMVRVAGRLAGTLRRIYGIRITTSTLKGHRDHSGQSTSCPGNNLHRRLGTIRSIASSQRLGSSVDVGGGGSGGSCTHTYGGVYSDNACSAGYQCCDGNWRTKGACGTCSCTERTGERGCTATPPPPPPTGDSCTHSYGGRYGDSACSAGYQCCDGNWRTRGACGACSCVETTGERGCGAGSAPPPSGGSSTYALPFNCGFAARCSNGNHTSLHTGKDAYAYDFAVPRGTTVRAMRGGTVLRVRNVSGPGSACYDGGGSSCANLANTVEIKHSDGTVGLYMHLAHGTVRAGQRLAQGDVIGTSGNSGWSTGPHLHVQVQQDCGIWWCQSVRFSFGERASISRDSVVTSQNCR